MPVSGKERTEVTYVFSVKAVFLAPPRVCPIQATCTAHCARVFKKAFFHEQSHLVTVVCVILGCLPDDFGFVKSIYIQQLEPFYAPVEDAA